MTPHTVTKFPPFELWNGGRPIQVVHSTKDPISSEIKHFTTEEYSDITEAKRQHFEKLQDLSGERLIMNGELMKEKYTKVESSSKFKIVTTIV